MTKRHCRSIGVGSLLLIVSFGVAGAGTAHAQECITDADCGAGSECRVRKQISCSGGGCMGDAGGPAGVGGMAGEADAGAAGAAAGAGGMAGGCEPEPTVCEAVAIGLCEPLPCESDAACLEGMICSEQTAVRCETIDPCPLEPRCEVDPGAIETVCNEETSSTCIARHALACTTDADCGGGFACLAGGEVCTCDGGGAAGAGGNAGADPGMAGMGECTCTMVHYCELLLLPCDDDAQCPSPLSCVPNPCTGCGGGTAGAGGGPADAGVAGGTGGTDPMAPPSAGMGCEPDPSAPVTVCRPPDYLGYYGCPGGGSEMGGSGGVGGDPGSAGAGAGGSAGSGNQGGGGQGTGDAGIPAGGSGGSSDHPWPPRPHHGFPHFGCAVTTTSSADVLGFAWFCISLVMLRLRARKPR